MVGEFTCCLVGGVLNSVGAVVCRQKLREIALRMGVVTLGIIYEKRDKITHERKLAFRQRLIIFY
jgi:hypothetical protein